MEDRVVGEEHRSKEDLVRVSLVWLLFFGVVVSIFSGSHQIQSPPYDFLFSSLLFSSLTHLYREIVTTTVFITGCAGNISDYTRWLTGINNRINTVTNKKKKKNRRLLWLLLKSSLELIEEEKTKTEFEFEFEFRSLR